MVDHYLTPGDRCLTLLLPISADTSLKEACHLVSDQDGQGDMSCSVATAPQEVGGAWGGCGLIPLPWPSYDSVWDPPQIQGYHGHLLCVGPRSDEGSGLGDFEIEPPGDEDPVDAGEQVNEMAIDLPPAAIEMAPEVIDMAPEEAFEKAPAIEFAHEVVDKVPETFEMASLAIDSAPEAIDSAPEAIELEGAMAHMTALLWVGGMGLPNIP